MQHRNQIWWFWTRAVTAVILASLLVALALPGAGRIVVGNSANRLTYHAIWGVSECLPSIGLALFSLAAIFIGMWKQWSFEIVGWAILVVFVLIGMFAA